MSRQIAILAVPGCQSLDVVGPLEVFHAARRVQQVNKRRDLGYEPFVVGVNKRPLRAESGLILQPTASLRSYARGPKRLHTLLVAGGSGARKAAKDTQVVQLLRAAADRSQRVASVCTGTFLLAAAGLLDGKRATTHWSRCDALARDYPRIEVERDPIYVRDGRVWSSAGVTAGIDLALALVEADLGREVAMLVARYLVVFVRRAGGQSQFSAQLSVQTAERDPLRQLVAYVSERPDADLSVPTMAARCAMSVRNFSRAFHAQLGATPAAYVERVRVEVARGALESSQNSIEQVAQQSGFGTPEALRRAFARRVGLSPREYRARFGGALDSAAQ